MWVNEIEFSKCTLGVMVGGNSSGALSGVGKSSIGRRALEPYLQVASRSTKMKGGAAKQTAGSLLLAMSENLISPQSNLI